MKILITGGTGFIGRNLKEQLSERHEICAPNSLELNLLNDTNVKEYLKKNKFDIIIHSAKWHHKNDLSYDPNAELESNLRMFLNLSRCSSLFDKMYYFGSGAEFGREFWKPKMPEKYFDTHVPKEIYGFSKYVMNKLICNADNIYNLRLFGIFGKYEDWKTRFISNACCKVVGNKSVTINQNVFFDYLYIDDLVRIIEWFIENEPGERTYNICTGITFDLLTLAKKVIQKSNKNIEIKIKKDGLGNEYSGDNSLFLKEIGSFKFNDIDDSISQLYDWYVENKNLLFI